MERTYTFTDCELAELILEFQDAEYMDYAELVENLNNHLRDHE